MCDIFTDELKQTANEPRILTSNEVIRSTSNELSPEDLPINRYTPQIESLPTTNLILNHPYSYKDLCNLLDQPTKSGNQKKRQLAEFKRFFQYNKEGTKYIITSFITPPTSYLPIEDTIPQNSKYQEDLINVILSFLYNRGQDALYVSRLDLIILTGLANHFYQKYFYDHQQLSESLFIPQPLIDNFYTFSYPKLYNTLSSTLNAMQSRRMIMYVPTYIIQFRTTSSPTYELREATEHDIPVILQLESDILHTLRLSSINDLWYAPPSIKKTYYTLFNEAIRSHNPYWTLCYRTIKIYSKASIIRPQSPILSKRSLNLKMFNFLNDQMTKQAAEILSDPDLPIEEYQAIQETLLSRLISIF